MRRKLFKAISSQQQQAEHITTNLFLVMHGFFCHTIAVIGQYNKPIGK